MQSQISIFWIRFSVIILTIIFIGIFYQLYNLQIVKHDDFKSKSSGLYFNPYSREKDRGSIIFSYKDEREFFAATTKTGYIIEINPQIIKNPEDTYNILSTIIQIDADDFLKKATKENSNSQIIAEKVSIEDAEKIKNLRLQGVSIIKEKWRFYPGKSLASQVIGFQAFKGDEYSGRYGLERYYDQILTKENQNLFTNFFVEIFSGLKNSMKGSVEGTLVTNIEPSVQTFSEKIVEDVQQKWNSQKTGLIIMNPKNGAIYSIALAPSFDVNSFNLEKDISVYNNHAVESIYEVGSIIKPLTLAIGFDTGKIIPESTYNDVGSMTMNGRTFYNHDKVARGVVGMQEVINKSLNVGAAWVAQQVGNKDFGQYMKNLLGEKTNIDLPNEVSPLISNLESNRDIEFATASFGQGIAMTPIQTIRALATLANGGYLVQPHVVKEIKYGLGIVKDVSPKEKKQIFKKESTEKITDILINAVDDALLGGSLSIKNYSVGAKTGTAQMIDQVNGGYLKNSYLHSFFGYFPAYEPQFIILMYTVDPKGVLYAHDTLARPFNDIVKYLINYYELEPDR